MLEITYKVTDDVSGLSSSGKVLVNIEGTTEESGLKMETILTIALPIIGFIVLAVCVREYTVRNQLAEDKAELAESSKLINELKEDLKLAMAYNKKEQEMIEENFGQAVFEKLLIKSEDIESHEMIGKGAFGEVFKAMYRGQAVAVKVRWTTFLPFLLKISRPYTPNLPL